MRRLTERIPFRLRLTLWFTGITAVTLLFFSSLLYRTFVQNQQAEFDAALYNHAVDVAQSIGFDFFGNLALESSRLSQGEKVFPFAPGKALLQIRRGDGVVLAASQSAARVQLPWEGPGFSTISISGASHRLLTYQIDHQPRFDLVLQLAVPMVMLEKERRNLMAFFFLAVPSVLALSAIGGLWVSRRALSPLVAITEAARQVRLAGPTHAGQVPVPRSHDEHRMLAETLNELFMRLRLAFESQDQFIANASHQLRTPLAILRGELDLIRSAPRSDQEVREFLASASQEIDYLTRVVDDLLLLARVDSGLAQVELEPVRLDDLLLESVTRLERLARAKEISLVPNVFVTGAHGEPVVRGEPELLQSLVRNLIENAIKYSPAGSRIDVQLEEAGSEHLALSVLDQGPGVPPEQLSRVFDRFYREKQAETRAPGSGLGLAIARRIAEIHGGELAAANRSGGGAEFKLKLRRA